MDLAEQERVLLQLAVSLGVQVRQESFDGGVFWQNEQRGGLCILQKQPILLLDTTLTQIERIVLLCEALCTFDYGSLEIAPQLRQRLDLARRKQRARKQARRPKLRRVV